MARLDRLAMKRAGAKVKCTSAETSESNNSIRRQPEIARSNVAMGLHEDQHRRSLKYGGLAQRTTGGEIGILYPRAPSSMRTRRKEGTTRRKAILNHTIDTPAGRSIKGASNAEGIKERTTYY